MQDKMFTTIKISDIVIGERKRQNFDFVPSLAQSISEKGLLQPILIDTNNKLIAGECRIRAVESLGIDKIDAVVIPIDQISDRDDLEYAENNDRKDFTTSEKVAIAISIAQKVKESGERRGRNAKGVDNSTDTNMDGGPEKGEVTRDFVAKRAGFRSSRSYRDARTVLEKARPEIIQAMDQDEISITGAHKIANMPKGKQLSALEEARSYPDSDGTELLKSQTSRRKAKRKEKNNIPAKHEKKQIFNIIRIAPDWNSVLQHDLLETPVNDYADPKICICTIECNALTLPRALECIDQWEFELAGLITVHNPKAPSDIGREFTHNITNHIIIGKRLGEGDIGEVIQLNAIEKCFPVLARYSDPLSASLIPIIEELFPNKSDKRIDMTSSTKRRNWICWKTSYGVGAQPEVDPPFEQENAFEQAALETNVNDDTKPDTLATSITEESAEEVFEPRKTLKVF